MSKRLTDTDIWNGWFRDLSPEIKLMWFYLKDQCEFFGVWKVDQKGTNFNLNAQVDLKEFLSVINTDEERVVVLNDKYWFLPGFVPFQYGDLAENNGSRSLIKTRVLDKLVDFQNKTGLDISQWIQQYTEPKLKSLPKKKKDPAVKKEREYKKHYADLVTMTEKEYAGLVTKYGPSQTQKMIEKLQLYKMQSGKEYKSDWAAIRQWVIESCGVVELQQSINESNNYITIKQMAPERQKMYADMLTQDEQLRLWGEVQEKFKDG